MEHKDTTIKTYFKAIIIIVALFFLATFGIKNSQPVELSYYFNTFNIVVPLYGVVYACIVIGIIVGMLVGFLNRCRFKSDARAYARENKALEAQVSSLKTEVENLKTQIKTTSETLVQDTGAGSGVNEYIG